MKVLIIQADAVIGEGLSVTDEHLQRKAHCVKKQPNWLPSADITTTVQHNENGQRVGKLIQSTNCS